MRTRGSHDQMDLFGSSLPCTAEGYTVNFNENWLCAAPSMKRKTSKLPKNRIEKCKLTKKLGHPNLIKIMMMSAMTLKTTSTMKIIKLTMRMMMITMTRTTTWTKMSPCQGIDDQMTCLITYNIDFNNSSIKLDSVCISAPFH